MTNVIVAIPTGYVISRDTVEWLYRSNTTGLQRVLFYNQQLITFFSHVSAHHFVLPRLFAKRVQKWTVMANNVGLHLGIGNWVLREKIDKFCYLEDVQVYLKMAMVCLCVWGG